MLTHFGLVITTQVVAFVYHFWTASQTPLQVSILFFFQ